MKARAHRTAHRLFFFHQAHFCFSSFLVGNFSVYERQHTARAEIERVSVEHGDIRVLSGFKAMRAALIVMERSASSSGSPSRTASAAHTGRYCSGITGWSVIIANSMPLS